MYLKSLIISSGDRIIRDIRFHDGLNLIVDETHSNEDTETGNNVGKTTVLVLIDFCLAGDSRKIYTDPENKKEEYKLVKDFLIHNNVLITLILKSDLSIKDSDEIVIKRNFLSRKQMIREINGVSYTEDEFESTLTRLLFPGKCGEKPTLRQIISHNIRYKDLSLTNTLRILDNKTSNAEYETLYLYLLGCDFEQGGYKQELLSKIKIEETFKSRLEQNQTKSVYEAVLVGINDDIEALNRKKSNFNLNENLESDLEQLNQIKYKINLLSSEINRLNLRRELIREAERDLNSKVSHIDARQLEFIYKQVIDKIGGIQKSFEDLLHFHNRMIAEKVKFITKDLPVLDAEIKLKNDSLKQLLEEEKIIADKVVKSDSFEDLEKLIKVLNEKYRRKGEIEKTIQQLDEVESNLKEFNRKLNDIDNELFSETFERKIKEQVNKFNRHFASVSQRLYGEKYALTIEPTTDRKSQRVYKFSAFNLNLSSGKKQGEIACFDIAYILFADEENIPCLHFLLNDKKELMHDNQLANISDLVNEKKIQFVASILKDKLPDELNKEEFLTLKLSQEDKLFRIENKDIL